MLKKENFWILGIIVVLLAAGLIFFFRPKLADKVNIINSPTPTVFPTAVVAKQPKMQIDSKKQYAATLKTNFGDITINLDVKETPITSNNFITLARKGFYDETIFHRVIDGFMIQGGDPEGTGSGGPGYTIPDEIMGNNKNDRGTISMANAGPNTGGSQFFINLVNNSHLDTKHAVFGKVVDGMDVVDKIGKTKTDPNDKPLQPVTIKSISIVEK